MRYEVDVKTGLMTEHEDAPVSVNSEATPTVKQDPVEKFKAFLSANPDVLEALK